MSNARNPMLVAGAVLAVLGAVVVVVGATIPGLGIAVIGVVLAVVSPNLKREPKEQRPWVIRQPAEPWLRQLSLQLASLPRHRVTPLDSHAFQVERSGPGAGRIVVAVVLFPFGLLALIGAGSRTGTVSVVQSALGTEVQLAGRFSGRCNRVLDDSRPVSQRRRSY